MTPSLGPPSSFGPAGGLPFLSRKLQNFVQPRAVVTLTISLKSLSPPCHRTKDERVFHPYGTRWRRGSPYKCRHSIILLPVESRPWKSTLLYLPSNFPITSVCQLIFFFYSCRDRGWKCDMCHGLHSILVSGMEVHMVSVNYLTVFHTMSILLGTQFTRRYNHVENFLNI